MFSVVIIFCVHNNLLSLLLLSLASLGLLKMHSSNADYECNASLSNVMAITIRSTITIKTCLCQQQQQQQYVFCHKYTKNSWNSLQQAAIMADIIGEPFFLLLADFSLCKCEQWKPKNKSKRKQNSAAANKPISNAAIPSQGSQKYVRIQSQKKRTINNYKQKDTLQHQQEQ